VSVGAAHKHLILCACVRFSSENSFEDSLLVSRKDGIDGVWASLWCMLWDHEKPDTEKLAGGSTENREFMVCVCVCVYVCLSLAPTTHTCHWPTDPHILCL